jgi:hypothetical protein
MSSSDEDSLPLVPTNVKSKLNGKRKKVPVTENKASDAPPDSVEGTDGSAEGSDEGEDADSVYEDDGDADDDDGDDDADEDEEKERGDDDVPVINQKPAPTGKSELTSAKKEPVVNEVGEDGEDSDDDDLPLAAKVNPKPNQKLGTKKHATVAKRSAVKGELKKPAKGPAKGAATKRAAKPEPAISKTTRKSRASKDACPSDTAVASAKFELPGQRKETPATNDPMRLFYESMYHERIKLKNPSFLAETWMLHNGLLPLAVAKKVYDKRRK